MRKNIILVAVLAIQCSILGANTLEKAYFDGDNPPSQSNYEGWDLRQVVFDTIDMGGFNFASANLLSVEILSSDNGEYFKDLNFAGASWSGGKFSSSAPYVLSSVTNANFSDSLVNFVTFQNLAFGGTSTFKNANLESSIFDSVTFSNTSFAGAVIRNALFSNSDFDKSKLVQTASYKDGDLSGVYFISASSLIDFSGTNFSSMDLTYSLFTGANLAGANFSLSKLGGSILANSDFTSADFRGASEMPLLEVSVVKNTIMSDGAIGNVTMREASDKIIVNGSAGGINAKLESDANFTDGVLELKDGGIFEICDGVSLSLSDDFEIIFEAGSADEIFDILAVGDGATIVMSDCLSDEEAQQAFINAIRDSEGNLVNWAPDSVASFVFAVPEPSTYAAVSAFISLLLVLIRRRK